MAKVKFIVSSISSSFWSILILSLNYTQYTKTLNSMSLEITNFFGEITDNWRNDLFAKNLYKTIESCQ